MQCQGRDPDKETKMIEEYGYMVHMVYDDPDTGGANLHSHGITRINCPDLQIVVGLPPNILSPLFNDYYEMMKSGQKIEIGKNYDEFLHGYSVQFIWAVEQNRDVLRMILPDKQGNLDKEKMDDKFSFQWKDTSTKPTIGNLKGDIF